MANIDCNFSVHPILVGGVADLVLFDEGSSFISIEVVNRDATNPIYFRTDGQPPTVAGTDCWVVMPGQSRTVAAASGVAEQVQLISVGGAAYSVLGSNRSTVV